MKSFFKKITGFFSNLKGKIPTPKFVIKMRESERSKKVGAFLNKYAFFIHIPYSLLIVFVIEWLAQHSFIEAIYFVTHHTGAYLYDSFVVFALLTLCFVTPKQTFFRVVISAIIIALGVTNSIVLANRVTPFGFVDLTMITDLLTMQNTNYFSKGQAVGVVIGFIILVIYLVFLFIRGKHVKTKTPLVVRILVCALCIGSIPLLTKALCNYGILSSYFGNLAQGYKDYGFIYGFETSVMNRGMSKPKSYNKETIEAIVENDSKVKTTISDNDKPNIVVVLLESFYDVDEVNFLETSEDPTPYFHYLEENFSTGHLTVPVVGAGTCNSEFEVITGMSCRFFGPGEYPQKTILKQTDCESIASDLKTLGYGSHVVHNNGGNFYSRANAFSMMGFDTFQSKEMLDITDYTPLGSWPTDDILIDSTVDAMARTDGPDFVYTITVEAHGDYPEYEVETDPVIGVTCDGKTEGQTYAWSYYVNRIYNVDDFIKQYIAAIDATGEDTLVIFFGDHLPTMGLKEDEIATGDVYKTKYITWNNFGMEKEDEDLTTYQLVPEFLDRLGIHDGTIVSYNQTAKRNGLVAGTKEYMEDFELLQYDLLYGKRYAYNGQDKYPASDLEMGIKDIVIDSAYFFDGKLHIYGENFSKWSKVYVNGEKVNTDYVSGQCLTINKNTVAHGDVITVCQVGSSSTVFRESNEYIVVDPNFTPEEESKE